jgi:seryl-tRNA synthetase
MPEQGHSSEDLNDVLERALLLTRLSRVVLAMTRLNRERQLCAAEAGKRAGIDTDALQADLEQLAAYSEELRAEAQENGEEADRIIAAIRTIDRRLVDSAFERANAREPLA